MFSLPEKAPLTARFAPLIVPGRSRRDVGGGPEAAVGAWRVSCGGGPIGSSTIAGLTGHTDVVDVRNDNDLGPADDFEVLIEVRFADGSACGTWTLTAIGNLTAPSNNCDP